jgi:hypothetical protein
VAASAQVVSFIAVLFVPPSHWTSVVTTSLLDAKARDRPKYDEAVLAHDGIAAPLGADACAILQTVDSCSDTDQLDEVGRQLWKGYGQGKINDSEAHYISSFIERRRPLRRSVPTNSLGNVAGGRISRFIPRQRQRSPDRKASRERRRMLGGSSALPDKLRSSYTEGQRSVLCIIAGEVKRCGACDFPIEKIAALAGVCRTTVQSTIHEARRLGHIGVTERPQRGRKNLSNVVEIICAEWRAWIRRASSAARPIGSNSTQMTSPTKNSDLRKRLAEAESSKK